MFMCLNRRLLSFISSSWQKYTTVVEADTHSSPKQCHPVSACLAIRWGQSSPPAGVLLLQIPVPTRKTPIASKAVIFFMIPRFNPAFTLSFVKIWLRVHPVMLKTSSDIEPSVFSTRAILDCLRPPAFPALYFYWFQSVHLLIMTALLIQHFIDDVLPFQSAHAFMVLDSHHVVQQHLVTRFVVCYVCELPIKMWQCDCSMLIYPSIAPDTANMSGVPDLWFPHKLDIFSLSRLLWCSMLARVRLRSSVLDFISSGCLPLDRAVGTCLEYLFWFSLTATPGEPGILRTGWFKKKWHPWWSMWRKEHVICAKCYYIWVVMSKR